MTFSLPSPLSMLKVPNIKWIQLFRERLSEKNVHATIPKGNIGYGQYTVPDLLTCQTYFCCFPLALTNVRPWPLVPFFETSLKSSELKTTHNPFRDCRVHFFRQPFSKQLYIKCQRSVQFITLRGACLYCSNIPLV